MEAQILDQKLGTVGDIKLELKQGKLVLAVGASEPQGSVAGQVLITVDAIVVLDLIAKAIPGTIDDAVLGVVKAALAAK